VPTPTAVSSLSSGVTSVHTGLRHTCAIVADAAASAEDKLYCWGWNADGQLGLGSTQDERTPALVNVIAPVWVSLGRQHSCAVVKTGALLCWGYNAYGQLGTGNTQRYLTPTPVVGLSSGVVTVALGEYHSCAIITGNVLKCWGWNSFGQLGIGSTVNQLTAATVPLTAEVDAVHAGAAFSCAVLSGGSLICWGSSVGLGVQSSVTNQLSPGQAVFGDGQIVALASAGLYFACAGVVGGSLMCWGDFRGVGSPTTLPTNVVGFDAGEVTALGLGHGHACAITSGGAVKCWGGGGYGQLGIGSYSDQSLPATVSSLNALAIASGGIPNAVSSVSFVISPIDRIAFKSAVSITLGFKPSVPIPPGSVVALIYPSGFFAPGITPIVARGSTSIPDITMSCGPTTATRITIVTSGAAISASHFAATLSGLTMGQATDGGSVTVQTSGAYSARVLSGPISGIAPASLTISHALPNALQGACGFPSLTPPPPTFPSHLWPL
jgi:alpha-tubulin suppressor-like RCC1 family protein